MSYLMDYVMRSHGIKSDHVDIQRWPIITDDNFEPLILCWENQCIIVVI